MGVQQSFLCLLLAVITQSASGFDDTEPASDVSIDFPGPILVAPLKVENKWIVRPLATCGVPLQIVIRQTADAYLFRSFWWAWGGDTNHQMIDVTEAILKDPGSVRAYRIRGELLWEKEDDRSAARDFEKVVELSGPTVTVLLKAAESNIGIKEYKKAIQLLDQIIQMDRSNSDAFYFLGYAKMRGTTKEDAIRDLTEAIRLKPQNADAYMARAAGYALIEDYDAALLDIDAAAECGIGLDSHEILMRKTGIYWLAKRDSEAIDCLDKAISSFNKDATGSLPLSVFYWVRGMLLFEQNSQIEREKSFGDLTEAIRLEPKFSWFWFMRGLAGCQNDDENRRTRALADLNEAIRLNPKNAVYRQVRALFTARPGKSQDLRLAEEDLTEALRTPFDRDSIQYLRGKVRILREDYKGALDDLTDASRSHERSHWMWLALAEYLATCVDDSVRDGKEALRIVDRVHISEDSKRWYRDYVLALAYAELDEFDLAIASANDALQIAPIDNKTRIANGIALIEQRLPVRTAVQDSEASFARKMRWRRFAVVISPDIRKRGAGRQSPIKPEITDNDLIQGASQLFSLAP